MLKQVESIPDSPEELLQTLETQRLLGRKARADAGRTRIVILAGGLLLLIGGTLIALMVLFSMVRDLPRPAHGSSQMAAE